MYFVTHTALAVIFLLTPKYSSACNGYVYKFHHLLQCAENNVIKMINPTSTLDKDCYIHPKGCMVTTGFKTAMMHYRAEKKPLPSVEGNVDLCKALADKNEYALIATEALGLPSSCPFKATKVCPDSNKKVSIAKYKSKLGIALGVSEVNLTITHDTGTTCLSLKVEFSKPRRRG